MSLSMIGDLFPAANLAIGRPDARAISFLDLDDADFLSSSKKIGRFEPSDFEDFVDNLKFSTEFENQFRTSPNRQCGELEISDGLLKATPIREFFLGLSTAQILDKMCSENSRGAINLETFYAAVRLASEAGRRLAPHAAYYASDDIISIAGENFENSLRKLRFTRIQAAELRQDFGRSLDIAVKLRELSLAHANLRRSSAEFIQIMRGTRTESHLSFHLAHQAEIRENAQFGASQLFHYLQSLEPRPEFGGEPADLDHMGKEQLYFMPQALGVDLKNNAKSVGFVRGLIFNELAKEFSRCEPDQILAILEGAAAQFASFQRREAMTPFLIKLGIYGARGVATLLKTAGFF